ncbi:MAG: two-component regulator propeller domain-containing protein, partial [Bacteroidota bacterium]
CLGIVRAQEHHFQHFTTQDGLPTNSIYGCIQDREGYIWIYTEKGVSKFDGYTFKNFTVADGLPTNDVWGLTEDKAGRIWVHGYTSKATYIQNDAVFTIPIKGTGLVEVVNTLAGEVMLFTGLQGFYYIFDGQQLHSKDCVKVIEKRKELTDIPYLHFGIYDSGSIHGYVPITDKVVVALDCAGNILATYQKNIGAQIRGVMTPASKMFFTQLAGHNFWINGDAIFRITQQPSDFDFKLVTFDSLIPFAPNAATQYWIQDSLLQFSVDAGLLITDADLKALDFYDTRFLAQKGITLNRKIKDREGNIWIATEDQGLFLLPVQARQISTYIPFENTKVTTLTVAENKYYFGTEDGAVYLLENGQIKQLLKGDFASNPVLKIALYGQQRLIVVRDLGAGLLNTRTKQLTDFREFLQLTAIQRQALINDQMTFSAIKDFEYDVENEQFIFAHFSGLYVFYRGANQRFFYKKVDWKRTIGVTVDTEETIWTAHDDGLSYVTKKDNADWLGSQPTDFQ